MTKRKNTQDKAALLALCPPDAARVQVKDELGKIRWREIVDVVDTDELIVNPATGSPYTMKASPGRKQAVVIAPTSPVVAEIAKRKRDFIAHDPVLSAVRKSPDSLDVFHEVLKALGEESASLAFERMEAERKGEETSNYSIRRINSLKATIDTWLKRRDQIGANGLDVESPAFGSVFEYLVDTFCQAMRQANMRSEAVAAVKAQLVKLVDTDDWKVEVKRRAREASK